MKKISNEWLVELLFKAKSGDNEAMTDILEMYMPLINKHSCINGKIDEDLRQEILFRIVKGVKNFNT